MQAVKSLQQHVDMSCSDYIEHHVEGNLSHCDSYRALMQRNDSKTEDLLSNLWSISVLFSTKSNIFQISE